MNNPKYIEVVGGAIIENPKNEILLVKSSRWGNKWVMPGGHIETMETIEKAIKREAEEEVGLKNLTSLGIICYGELINSKDFHRPAHFIYFDVLLRTDNTDVRLDNIELSDYLWVMPERALEMELGESYDRAIRE
jgi:nucleoside triphosphatase